MMNEDFDQSNEQLFKAQRIKSCQTLTMVALIGAPVSLLIGGVALSTVALVCAILAFARMRKLHVPEDVPGSIERTLYAQSMVALGISVAAMTMNLIAFVYMFGAIMEMIKSGDPSALFDSVGNVPSQDESSSTSIWDR